MLVQRKMIVSATVLAVALLAFWIVTAPESVPSSALGPHSPNLQNGKELLFAGGCPACHAPEKGDLTKLGGGVALKFPFGTFYSTNISSDPRDGIGGWTEAEFISAMVKGTSPDGRHLYPVFPYTSFRRMSLDDLRDLFAYLKTLPPVSGKSPPHELPFYLRIRRTLGVWKLLYLRTAQFKSNPAESPEWNRGAYLVNGAGHCAECHSPRNIFGATIDAQRFAGGPDPEGEGWIPNITQEGLKDWSVRDIEEVLASGETPTGKVGGSMLAVVRDTANLSPEDRTAMAVYLKSLPPVVGPPAPKKQPR